MAKYKSGWYGERLRHSRARKKKKYPSRNPLKQTQTPQKSKKKANLTYSKENKKTR